MSAAASPADILAGLERWSRVRRSPGDGQHVAHIAVSGYDWRVWTGEQVWARDLVEVALWRVGGFRRLVGEWTVSPAIALAWALLVETGAASVDVGRCPACVARSPAAASKLTTWEWTDARPGEWAPWCLASRDERARALEDAGWTVRTMTVRADGRPRAVVHGSRPCPACNGTGIETAPAARLLLDAASGDARALANLDVHATLLQSRGDPTGELLGWALTQWLPPLRVSDCEGASPHDSYTGDAHTAEAVRWLEWLTWGREFERERDAQAPSLREEVEALARASVLSYADTFDLVARAVAAGATYAERQRLGVHGMVMLVNAYESGALAPR